MTIPAAAEGRLCSHPSCGAVIPPPDYPEEKTYKQCLACRALDRVRRAKLRRKREDEEGGPSPQRARMSSGHRRLTDGQSTGDAEQANTDGEAKPAPFNGYANEGEVDEYDRDTDDDIPPSVHRPTAAEGDHEAAAEATVDAAPPFDANNSVDADVILRSSDLVDFWAHKAILAFSSSTFRSMFNLPGGHWQGHLQQQEDNKGTTKVPLTTKNGLPIVKLTEKEEPLYRLLYICYPECPTLVDPTLVDAAIAKPDTLEDVLDVLEPAIKYEMVGAEKRLRRCLTSARILEGDPLRVYALAIQYRFEQEAKIAAAATLKKPLSDYAYVPELESITGGDLRRLHNYHTQCTAAAQKVAMNLEWLERDVWAWFECTGASNNNCIPPRRGSPMAQVTISGARTKRVRSPWWSEYMQLAAEKLAKTPVGDAVLDIELVDQAVAKAIRCPACRSRAIGDMRDFSNHFADEVARVTSEIQIDVVFG